MTSSSTSVTYASEGSAATAGRLTVFIRRDLIDTRK